MKTNIDRPGFAELASGLPTADAVSGAASTPVWIVGRGSFNDFFVAGPVSKRTAQRIYHPDKWGGKREAFTDLSSVLFEGAEDVCRRLHARCISSNALSQEEQKAAWARHEHRIEKLVAAATLDTAASPSPGDEQG